MFVLSELFELFLLYYEIIIENRASDLLKVDGHNRLMGSKKRNASYKTKKSKKKSRPKKKKLPAEKDIQCKNIENGLIDICSTLENLAVDPANSTLVKSQNATSKFLSSHGLNNSVNKRCKKRKSKKNLQKTYSMVKLLSSLPKNTTEEPDNGQNPEKNIEKVLPVKLVPSSDFYYKQRDSKKFFKRILRKERSRQKKSHL